MNNNLEKIKGLELLEKNKIPVLPYIILEKNNYREQLTNFIEENGLKKFMVRTAGVIPKFHGTPSINNATLDNLDSIKEYVDMGFTVIISHPGNTYRNLYSLNIMKDKKEVIIDIVGPGFIASDLNRLGHAHEEMVFDKKMNLKSRKELISPERYKSEVDNKIQDKKIERLKENNSYLLEYDNYSPITEEEINYIKKNYKKIDKAGKELGFENWVASMSFVDLGKGDEPIFWDLYGIR